jgi:glycosyltransferase involved in cell wall biosynthesis
MKFTIITATWNNQDTIEELCESINSQSFKDFEFLVNDNCSTDNTISIVKKLVPSANIQIQKDSGIYDAFNKALNRCTGNWIIFLGADDFLLDGEVLNKVNKYSLNENATIIYGGMYLYNSEKKLLYWHRNLTLSDYKSEYDYPIHAFPPLAATFFNKKIFSVLRFDNTYNIHGDADFYYKIHTKQLNSYKNLPINISAMGDAGTTSSLTNRVERVLQKFSIYWKFRKSFVKLQLNKISILKAILPIVKVIIRKYI